MKKLLYKEFKLCLHPAVFLFMASVLLLFIPNYMFELPCFFICNAIFFVFQQCTLNNDLLFTVTLPVGKREAVKARFAFIVIIQLVFLLLCIPMMFVHNAVYGSQNAAGLDVCPALIASYFIVYSIFNIIYMPTFYKNGYKAGKSFVLSLIGIFAWIFISNGVFITAAASRDVSAFFAWIENNIDCLPTTQAAASIQAAAIIVCAVIYVVLTIVSCRISERNLEKKNI